MVSCFFRARKNRVGRFEYRHFPIGPYPNPERVGSIGAHVGQRPRTSIIKPDEPSAPAPLPFSIASTTQHDSWQRSRVTQSLGRASVHDEPSTQTVEFLFHLYRTVYSENAAIKLRNSSRGTLITRWESTKLIDSRSPNA